MSKKTNFLMSPNDAWDKADMKKMKAAGLMNDRFPDATIMEEPNIYPFMECDPIGRIPTAA